VPATADEPAAFVRQAVALNREPEGSARTRWTGWRARRRWL